MVNAPGALMWNELSTGDIDAAAGFYGELFGWEIQETRPEPERYLAILNGDARNGGIRGATPPDFPPHWLVYFAVEDLDAAMARAGELGGAVHAGPIDIGPGRLAVVADPQGAFFALYEGQMDP